MTTDRRHSLASGISSAQALAPAIVAWNSRLGWFAVPLADWDASRGEADLLCLGLGKHPIPLSEAGAQAWFSLIQDRARLIEI